MDEDGMMSPKRGKKKRNGEYVLPKSVVEYHGIRKMKELENEAHWDIHDLMFDHASAEEEKEDDKDPQDEKPKKKKSKGFAIKKKVKTAYIK